ncbi:uncharacterized protein [Asterias amurensis]|uniref:uncharacterized protein n=1 Tax=Asterias amurensis TaxID=7602 RepID=UPI003AB6074C
MQVTPGQVTGSPAAFPPTQQHGAYQQPGFAVSTSGPQQQPPSLMTSPPPRRDYSRQMITLNSIQIANTVLNVSFGIAEIFLRSLIAFVGVSIWVPLCFYLPAGILGLLSGKIQSQRRCLAIGCLVMCILAAISAFVVLIVECVQAAVDYSDFYYCDHDYGYDQYYCTKGMTAARRTVSILSALVALLELVVSIVTSAYCCLVIGTGTQAKPMTVVYTTTTATPMGAYNINPQLPATPMGAYNVSPHPQFVAPPQNQYTPYPGVMPAAGGAAGGDNTVQLPPPSYNQTDLPTKN